MAQQYFGEKCSGIMWLVAREIIKKSEKCNNQGISLLIKNLMKNKLVNTTLSWSLASGIFEINSTKTNLQDILKFSKTVEKYVSCRQILKK